MEQRLNQLQAKFKADESLAEKMFSVETPEDVQSLLKEQGLDFTLEEIGTLREAIVKNLTKGENEELSDDDLENVAGGVAATTLIGLIPVGIDIGRKFGGGRRW